jgi:hypothetical protein
MCQGGRPSGWAYCHKGGQFIGCAPQVCLVWEPSLRLRGCSNKALGLVGLSWGHGDNCVCQYL